MIHVVPQLNTFIQYMPEYKTTPFVISYEVSVQKRVYYEDLTYHQFRFIHISDKCRPSISVWKMSEKKLTT